MIVLCRAHDVTISIHALRVESDYAEHVVVKISKQFQSTLSEWRATLFPFFPAAYFVISIHALRVESDNSYFEPPLAEADFNPRSPSGERH